MSAAAVLDSVSAPRALLPGASAVHTHTHTHGWLIVAGNVTYEKLFESCRTFCGQRTTGRVVFQKFLHYESALT